MITIKIYFFLLLLLFVFRCENIQLIFESDNGIISFAQDSYTFNIPEKTLVGAEVGTVIAQINFQGQDQDENQDENNEDENNQQEHSITYSIEGEQSDVFSISSDGLITLSQPLNFETVSTYSLTVTATDSESSSASVVVTINVIESVVRFSSFPANPLSIHENAPINSEITIISAQDPDGDSISYQIISGNTGNVFSIDSATGKITTASALDFESNNQYTLTIRAENASGENVEGNIIINLINVIHEPPSFVDIPANNKISYPIDSSSLLLNAIPLRAIDPEGQLEIRYRLAGVVPMNNGSPVFGEFWLLDGISRLRLSSPCVESIGNTYTLTIEAYEFVSHGSLTSQIEITVEITAASMNGLLCFSQRNYSYTIETDTGTVDLNTPTISIIPNSAIRGITYSLASALMGGVFFLPDQNMSLIRVNTNNLPPRMHTFEICSIDETFIYSDCVPVTINVTTP